MVYVESLLQSSSIFYQCCFVMKVKCRTVFDGDLDNSLPKLLSTEELLL